METWKIVPVNAGHKVTQLRAVSLIPPHVEEIAVEVLVDRPVLHEDERSVFCAHEDLERIKSQLVEQQIPFEVTT